MARRRRLHQGFLIDLVDAGSMRKVPESCSVPADSPSFELLISLFMTAVIPFNEGGVRSESHDAERT
jgi:hypothetical protein